MYRVAAYKGRSLPPAVSTSARRARKRPSEGIYYAVRFSEGWSIFICRFDEFGGETDHTALWEDYVCQPLALNWEQSFGDDGVLEEALHLHAYGFPRGRIARVPGGSTFNILHGGDLEKFMGISPETIERLFSVTGRAHWVRDEHEQCQEDDRDAVRRILRLKENWRAV